MSRRLMTTAAAVLLCIVPTGAHAQAVAPSPATGAGPAAAAPAWKSIYQNSQKIYYLDASNVPESGQSTVQSLLEFRIPQVVNGDQVWSIISRMKLSCSQRQIITVDNTLYAQKMGTGPVIRSQALSDTWHVPQPGSLGELIWSSACGKP